MADEGLKYLETYVYRHHNTVAQFIATRPIMDLCLAEERKTVPQVSRRRWKQDGLDVGGCRRRLWRGN